MAIDAPRRDDLQGCAEDLVAFSPGERLVMALQMTEMGLQMRLQRHRREHPDATQDDLDRVAQEWRQARPGAPSGDAAGPFQVRRGG